MGKLSGKVERFCMAKFSHCGRWVRATEYRILSDKPAYRYQRVLVGVCNGQCKKKIMLWCGEYPDGAKTDLYPVPPEKQAAWRKRFTLDKPRPKIQMTGEYTNRIRGPIEKQAAYQRKLRWAQSLPPTN